MNAANAYCWATFPAATQNLRQALEKGFQGLNFEIQLLERLGMSREQAWDIYTRGPRWLTDDNLDLVVKEAMQSATEVEAELFSEGYVASASRTPLHQLFVFHCRNLPWELAVQLPDSPHPITWSCEMSAGEPAKRSRPGHLCRSALKHEVGLPVADLDYLPTSTANADWMLARNAGRGISIS